MNDNLQEQSPVGRRQSRPDLPLDWFGRVDEEIDEQFYVEPRFVQHIDPEAIATITAAIARHVAPHSTVLDLMSSWVSHLPPAVRLPLARVVGLGMNERELAANDRLDQRLIQDLNVEPRLPFAAATFDAVLITVSIQYLTRPVAVLRDVNRVLRPNGVLLISFSNRMFATKAVRVWREAPEEARPDLVALYLDRAGDWLEPIVERREPRRHRFGDGDPLWVVVARPRPRP